MKDSEKHTSKQNSSKVRSSTIHSEEVRTKFGERTISNQNFSKIVALPKQALYNCGKDVRRVSIELVQTKTEKFLKLTPVTVEVE